MPEVKRIVVFTRNLNYAVRKGIVSVDEAIPGLTWLIVVHTPATRSWLRVIRDQWRNLKRDGWRRIPAVALALQDRLIRSSENTVPHKSPGIQFTTEQMIAAPNVEVRNFPNIHAQDAIQEIRAFAPDLGISLAGPILRPSLFEIPQLGTLNLHKGKLPNYRGMPPAFWEMWNEETFVGCTVHWVDEKLDTGPIAATSSIDCERYSTVKGLQLRLDEVGVSLMRDVVIKIAAGTPCRLAQSPGGKTYRQPTMKQVAALDRRITKRLPYTQSAFNRTWKNEIKKVAFKTGMIAMRRVASPRVTVLLYHRITDCTRDNLTTGIEQFDRQMKLLRRHFRIIPLSEVLEMDKVPKNDAPTVCVTFDDGYLDNYLNAAAILLRHQIPAAFFVSTGLIGTDQQFPHDVRRGNPPIPLMTWDHLREMHRSGFEIGSHTVSHIDCASEPLEVVEAELIQSREAIRREIGIERIMFSYPYGRKHHMTAERLEMVKRSGYIGCASAYGGTNIGKIDPYNILRRGTHWEYSDWSFLSEAMGLW